MHRSDVTSWRPLIGPHKSCAVRSEETIGRDFSATRVHGNGQTADGTLIYIASKQRINAFARKNRDRDGTLTQSKKHALLWCSSLVVLFARASACAVTAQR